MTNQEQTTAPSAVLKLETDIQATIEITNQQNEGQHRSTPLTTTATSTATSTTTSTTTTSNCCAACSMPIKDRFIFNVINQGNFHQQCVRCADCSISLNERCHTFANKLYCRLDYWRRFGPKCSACSEPIKPTELVQRLRHDLVYHLSCFVCQDCKRHLESGEQLHLMDNKQLLCKRDYMNQQHQHPAHMHIHQQQHMAASNLTLLNDGRDAHQQGANNKKQYGNSKQQAQSSSSSASSINNQENNNSIGSAMALSDADDDDEHERRHQVGARVAPIAVMQQINNLHQFQMSESGEQERGLMEEQERHQQLMMMGDELEDDELDGELDDGDSSSITADGCELNTNNNVAGPYVSRQARQASQQQQKSINQQQPPEDCGDDLVDANGKRRGPRTTIKPKQLETLKNAFASTPKPSRHVREQLANETGLNMRVIQVWFQNRRSKERRMRNSNGSARRNFFRSSTRRLRVGATAATTTTTTATLTASAATTNAPTPPTNGPIVLAQTSPATATPVTQQSLMAANNNSVSSPQTMADEQQQQQQQVGGRRKQPKLSLNQMSPVSLKGNQSGSPGEQFGNNNTPVSANTTTSANFTYFSDSSNQGPGEAGPFGSQTMQSPNATSQDLGPNGSLMQLGSPNQQQQYQHKGPQQQQPPPPPLYQTQNQFGGPQATQPPSQAQLMHAQHQHLNHQQHHMNLHHMSPAHQQHQHQQQPQHLQHHHHQHHHHQQHHHNHNQMNPHAMGAGGGPTSSQMGANVNGMMTVGHHQQPAIGPPPSVVQW